MLLLYKCLKSGKFFLTWFNFVAITKNKLCLLCNVHKFQTMEDYPVLSYEFACNKDGEIVAPESVTDSENVRNYMALQYYEMFDK